MSNDTIACSVITQHRGTYDLEVVACQACGFHLGLDASYLEQVGGIAIACPACGSRLTIAGAEDAVGGGDERRTTWMAAKRSSSEPGDRIAATITITRGGRITFHDPRNGEQTGSQFMGDGCTEDVDILSWDDEGMIQVRFADGDATYFELSDGHVRLAIRTAERRVRLTADMLSTWRVDGCLDIRFPGGFVMGIDAQPDASLASGSAAGVLYDADGAQMGTCTAPTCAGPFVVACPAGTFTASLLPPATEPAALTAG